jgi:2-dehydro-3-deoxyphosphogluconate aldolase/(4S)-4-hydroxy-2-oxoglutarate aldolase
VFPEVRFVPTGGIGIGNLSDYLRLPNVAACGGSWVAPRGLIAAGEFGEIARLAAEAVGVVRRVRHGS